MKFLNIKIFFETTNQNTLAELNKSIYHHFIVGCISYKSF